MLVRLRGRPCAASFRMKISLTAARPPVWHVWLAAAGATRRRVRTVASWCRRPPRARSCGVSPGRCAVRGARNDVLRRSVAAASVGVAHTSAVAHPAVRADAAARVHPARGGVGMRGRRWCDRQAGRVAPVRSCAAARTPTLVVPGDRAWSSRRRGALRRAVSWPAQRVSPRGGSRRPARASPSRRPTTVGQPNPALLLTMRPGYCEQDSHSSVASQQKTKSLGAFSNRK